MLMSVRWQDRRWLLKALKDLRRAESAQLPGIFLDRISRMGYKAPPFHIGTQLRVYQGPFWAQYRVLDTWRQSRELKRKA